MPAGQAQENVELYSSRRSTLPGIGVFRCSEGSLLVDLALPFDRSSSIQAERLAWAIERYASGELTAKQIEATHEFDPGYDAASHLQRFNRFRRPINEVLSFELGPANARAIVRSGVDSAIVSVWLSDAPEQRILAMALYKRAAEGVTTRRATETDALALRDLERRCAVETSGISWYYDRSDDYFAQQRMMPQHFSSVAEYEGRIVGVSSDAVRRIRIAGTEYRATYSFHLRVDPTARGLGILPALYASQSSAVFADRPLPITQVFIAAGNEQMLAANGVVRNATLWATPIERFLLPCRTLAGAPFGREAVPHDASTFAQVLAQSHASEELALDFDASWVSERMGRSARDYSWRNVILAEGAVLGVWDSGLSIVRTGASGTTETRTATAADWGFAPGAEDEMVALLRSACATLTTAGVEDLIVYSSPPSRGRDLLAGLARAVEPFLVNTSVAKPRHDATNGVYVDPVYF